MIPQSQSDTAPSELDVVLYVQREKHRLPDSHHEFIDDIASHIVQGRAVTPKQHQYLHSLFLELGGKVI